MRQKRTHTVSYDDAKLLQHSVLVRIVVMQSIISACSIITNPGYYLDYNFSQIYDCAYMYCNIVLIFLSS